MTRVCLENSRTISGMVQLLSFDIDGTLVSHAQREFSDSLSASFLKATATGVHLLFVTSRTPMAAFSLDFHQDWQATIAVCNGAAILNPVTGALSSVKIMSLPFVNDVFQKALSFDPELERVTYAVAEPKPRHSSQVRKLEQVPAGDWEIMRLTFRPATMHPSQLVNSISACFGSSLAVTFNSENVVEITPADTGKLRFVQEYAKTHGIDADSCVSFGDSMNDRDLLAWSGVGVGVRPEKPELSDVVSLYVDSPDLNGVANYLAAIL